MISIVLGTQMEARPLLERLGARKLADEPFEIYLFPASGKRPGGVIVISGMGKQIAAKATRYLIVERGATVVVNVGVCGALTDGAKVGQLFRITEAIDGDLVISGGAAEKHECDDDIWEDLPPARLVSVDEGVFQEDRRSALAAFGDVVDMEGAAVARICRLHNVRCYMLKGVSDLANHTGKEDIQRNIASVSSQLAGVAASALERYPQIHGTVLSRIWSFTKIEHSLFSFPLLLAGAWLGGGGTRPPLHVLALIIVAGLGARTLGMAMNRILDRDLDALNKRTAARELPSGRMSIAVAWGVAGVGLVSYLLACAALGKICLMLSPIPAALLITYSLLKRFTSLCHFGIGLCLALAPLGAFVAASGGVALSREVILLGVFTFCWISGFDIIYALQDLTCDRETGVHSIPAVLGERGAQIVAFAVHFPGAVAMFWLWQRVGGGILPGVALGIVIVGLAMGHWKRIPVRVRFFPVSPIVGIAGAMVPLLGELK